MYTNIDSNHEIEIMRKWLDKLEREGNLPEKFPKELVILFTKIIMNIFFPIWEHRMDSTGGHRHGYTYGLHLLHSLLHLEINNFTSPFILEQPPPLQVIH